jgi:hypothetical protein
MDENYKLNLRIVTYEQFCNQPCENIVAIFFRFVMQIGIGKIEIRLGVVFFESV